MAVTRVSHSAPATWFGLSTDTKPTTNSAQPGPKAGDRFVEVNTGYVYAFSAGAWTKVPGAVYTTGS